MRLSIGRVLADAWALWRADRDLLLRIVAPLVFVPTWALMLLLPPPPPLPGEASMVAQFQASVAYVSAHLGWYLAALLVTKFGEATVLALYCRRGAPTVGDAMRTALVLLPRYLLVSLLLSMATSAGLLLVIVGAFLVAGRTLTTAPILFGERPVGAVQAIARSITHTAGLTMPVAALAALLFSARLLAQPFGALDATMRADHADNPVALAIVDALGAGVVTAVDLAALLASIVLYRTLASRGT